MSLKEFLLSKDELVKGSVKVGEHDLEIRELTGSERAEMLRADSVEDSTRIAWNYGVLDASEHMDADEFAEVFKYRYTMVNKVVVEICRLSGYLDDEDETEKN